MEKYEVKLELNKILERLREKCNNDLSKELVDNLVSLEEISELNKRQQETTEAVDLLRLKPDIPVLRFSDIRGKIQRAKVGGILNPSELKDIKEFLYVARDVDIFLKGLEQEEGRIFYEFKYLISPYPTLLKELEKAIDEEGNIRDSASAKLSGIRKNMVVIKQRIRSRLDALIHSEAGDKYLQDKLVTMRGDRYVIPVKQEYRGQVQGIVHDQSGSGATLFIEPAFAVEMNNELRVLGLEEEEEIKRILKDFSNKIGLEAEGLGKTIAAMGEMDFYFAKGRLSHEMMASAPRLNDYGKVYLKSARHPLLKGKIVANDIEIGDKFHTVVITGPNTGGKTVTLKTLGLLALMVKYGLHIPCEPLSEMSVFKNIFADIGDEQSIEQSLSTYSAHLKNIIEILNKADSNSLILLDELGAGTDPVEGSALAMSILEYLHNLGASTMATTHYGELKVFAYSHEGVSNASVEFDTNTLAPTYKLLMGTPGLSNALIIAGRLGLSKDIIERAETYISGEELQVSKMIQDLEEKRREAAESREEAEKLSRKVAELSHALEIKEAEFKEKKRQILEQAYEEAEQIVSETRKEAEALLKELRFDLDSEVKDAQLRIANTRRQELKEKEKVLNAGIQKYKRENLLVPKGLKEGDRVLVLSLNQKGSVLKTPDSKNEVLVQVGIMKVQVPIKDLQLLAEEKKDVEKAAYVGIRREKGLAVSPEIDLRGATIDEARERLDKYIDDCYLAGLHSLRIIHGKGTGQLRSGVQEYLKGNKLITLMRIGDANEGGSGVTVIELKAK